MSLIHYLVVGRTLYRGVWVLGMFFGLNRWPPYRQLLDDEEMGVVILDALVWGTAIATGVLALFTKC